MACKFGCESGCKGMTTKTTTFKEKVFDPEAKEQPPHTLGEKFDRDGASGDYGPGVSGKEGYDPEFPNTPYDNDFATTPNALNDDTFISENHERKYNGEFDNSGNIVKTPKAFEYGKESILSAGEYTVVPEDSVYNPEITYYTRSGSGSANDPYIYTEHEFTDDIADGVIVKTKAQKFAELVNTAKGGIRVEQLFIMKRKFVQREMVNNGGTSSMNKVINQPMNANRTRNPDSYHIATGIRNVTMDGKALINVPVGESFNEKNEYYIKNSDGNFSRANVTINGYGGTWTQFTTYRNSGVLYKAGALISNTSGDDSSTTYN